ncbi:ALP1-like protein isoform X1 [Tanacetum coccineum]|uniref:ALP1-like protein isoform X1 n=1 Tax=Tanacetum coccineum TaxID=301880 RepID=A0ABQ4XGE3_9ASTR
MRREQKLEFLQRQLKRENQEQIGSCMTKISEECKNLLKEKMKEVMDFNSSLNNPTDSNKYQYYRCFKCKELGHIIKFCPNDKKKYKKTRMEGIEAPKPTVMVTYPETTHFSTTSMIKDTDLTTWDEIWIFVASQDLWIWHAFFGVAGSNNDINVLYQSPIFNDLKTGRAPEIPFVANGVTYPSGYYLVDGIYPELAPLVKTIPEPADDDHKRILFKQKQESARKDVERAFGVLKKK